MLELIQKLLGGVDWNTIVNILIAALAAWLGVPALVKEPGKLPIIGRLFGGGGAKPDDVDAGVRALRDLDAIHERNGVPIDERRRLLVDGFTRIVSKATETPK